MLSEELIAFCNGKGNLIHVFFFAKELRRATDNYDPLQIFWMQMVFTFFHFYKGSLEARLFSVRMYGKRSWAINLIMISWWGLPSGKDWILYWHMLASRLLIYEGREIADIYIYIYIYIEKNKSMVVLFPINNN